MLLKLKFKSSHKIKFKEKKRESCSKYPQKLTGYSKNFPKTSTQNMGLKINLLRYFLVENFTNEKKKVVRPLYIP